MVDQVDYLASLEADVVCLQEVTKTSAPLLADLLQHKGYLSFISTASEAQGGPRRYGVAIASRFPIQPLAPIGKPVWPERLLVVTCESGIIATTHIPPGSSNGFIKVEMLEAVFEEFTARSLEGPCILAGDFNAPQLELPELVTWAQRKAKDGAWRIMPSRGERWDLAERCFFDGRIADAFRSLHPISNDCSWELLRRGNVIPRRFDHTFHSRHWLVTGAEYSSIMRNLSDHAVLTVAASQTGERVSCSSTTRNSWTRQFSKP